MEASKPTETGEETEEQKEDGEGAEAEHAIEASM